MADERQMASARAGIRADHVARYVYAAGVVGGDVLDCACGCGYGSQVLAEAGHRVRGVDADAAAIDWARTHFPHERVSYNVGEAAHVPGAYDWVVCLETLEHVQDDGGLLRHFARIAKAIVLSVPNEAVVPYSRDRNPFHVRHYRAGELAALLRGAGWQPLVWTSQDWPDSPVVRAGADGTYIVVTATRA